VLTPRQLMTNFSRFDEFRFDSDRGLLFRDKTRVFLGAKPLELLRLLMANRDRAVSTEEILQTIWKGKAVKNPVAAQINILRKKLDPRGQEVIGTIGHSYRFIAEVIDDYGDGIPDPDWLLDQDQGPFFVTPAERPDIIWMASLARKVYRDIDIIPERTMLRWFNANPSGFNIVKTADGRRMGNLDILPIKPDTLESFVNGEITELEIPGDSLYRVDERDKIEDLYVESFVTANDPEADRPKTNAYVGKAVLNACEAITKRICNPATLRHIYAIAASDNGRSLLSRLGFTICVSKKMRRDHHDLYRAEARVVGQKLIRSFRGNWGDPTIMKYLGSDDSGGL
jgi:DNA-binding winged helix-turn-helix (wHTH) protein